jgi:hypothetical protein
MFKTLVAFGCSFTYGDELLDPNIKPGEPCNSRYNDDYRNSHCYAGLVADHYNLEFVNTAFPGGSLESMRYALHWVTSNFNLTETVLVAGLTQAHRNSYFDETLDGPLWNQFRHSTWLKENNNTEWHKLNQMWYKMCYSEDWEKYNLDLTVKYFESANALLLPVYNSEINFYSKNKIDFVLEDVLSESDLAPLGHPNESGHQKVAKRLIKYIDSVKLI